MATQVTLKLDSEVVTLYVSTYKDVKNKVIEFSDSPSKNITD